MEEKEEKKVPEDKYFNQQKGFKCIRMLTLLIYALQNILAGTTPG